MYGPTEDKLHSKELPPLPPLPSGQQHSRQHRALSSEHPASLPVKEYQSHKNRPRYDDDILDNDEAAANLTATTTSPRRKSNPTGHGPPTNRRSLRNSYTSESNMESAAAAQVVVQQEMNNVQTLKRLSIGALSTLDPDLPPQWKYGGSGGEASDATSPSATGSSAHYTSPPSSPIDGDTASDLGTDIADSHASELLWVPAHVHPELAPQEWKTFVQNKVAEIRATVTKNSQPSSLSGDSEEDEDAEKARKLNRRKSRLSKQLTSEDFEDESVEVERQPSTSSQQSISTLSAQLEKLGELESLAMDPYELVRSLSARPSNASTPNDKRQSTASLPASAVQPLANDADEPILPAPSSSLRRSTRTRYNKNTIRRGRRAFTNIETSSDGTTAKIGPPQRAASMNSDISPVEPLKLEPVRPLDLSRKSSRDGPSHIRMSPTEENPPLVSKHEVTDPEKRPTRRLSSKRDGLTIASNLPRDGTEIHAAIPLVEEQPQLPARDPARDQSDFRERENERKRERDLERKQSSRGVVEQQKVEYTKIDQPLSLKSPQSPTSSSLTPPASPSILPGNNVAKSQDSAQTNPPVRNNQAIDPPPALQQPKPQLAQKNKSKKGTWSWLFNSDKEKEKERESRSSQESIPDKNLVDKLLNRSEDDDNTVSNMTASTTPNISKGISSMFGKKKSKKEDDGSSVSKAKDRSKKVQRKKRNRSKQRYRNKDSDEDYSEDDLAGGSEPVGGIQGIPPTTAEGHLIAGAQPIPQQDIQLPYNIPLHQMSDKSMIMFYHRYPLHIERAIYRLSHLKLANPRRPLAQQVLLSNFMYAYLNLINHGYQQQQMAQLQQQQAQHQPQDPQHPEDYQNYEYDYDREYDDDDNNNSNDNTSSQYVQYRQDYSGDSHHQQNEAYSPPDSPSSSSSSSGSGSPEELWQGEQVYGVA